MKYFLFLCASMAGAIITAQGIQALVGIFAIININLLEALVLSLTISFLRCDPMSARENLANMDMAETIGICLAIIIMNCLAVYLFIPWLAERVQ